jgi:uncharacterized protein YdeI (YjbR/CyaY-like superfamily)
VREHQTLYCKSRAEWRYWLFQNHRRSQEIWLLFYKKRTGKKTLDYEDAVEEALCFGWIDSIVRRIDDEKYVQKFTPRKAGSQWSESNLERVRKLLSRDVMTKVGLELALPALIAAEKKPPVAKPKGEPKIPPDVLAAMKKNKSANEQFKLLPPGYVRTTLRWIDAAKHEDTRERRIAEFIEVTAQGRRIGLK